LAPERIEWSYRYSGMENQVQDNVFVKRRRTGRFPGKRPWRVVPLAVFAVIAVTTPMGAAAHVFGEASGHRYAGDILLAQIHKIHTDASLAR